MKRLLLVFALPFIVLMVNAQDDLDKIVDIHSAKAEEATPADSTKAENPWKYGGNFSVTFSQVSLTNWVAGGENSISGNASVLLTANYQKGKNKWDNTLDLGYGLTRQGGEDITKKNEDKIDFSSQFGRKASKHWYYSALFGFKSQFDKGYNYPDVDNVISDFLAPAYLLTSVGMDYRPSEKFTVLLSPITGRMTIVNVKELSDAGAFGVDPGKTTRTEMGGFVKVNYKDSFFEDKLGVRSRLELFSSYLDKPQNIDVNWEIAFDLKLGNYITARFQTIMIYDDDSKIGVDTNDDGEVDKQVAKLQIKELLGIGFSYKF